MRERLTRAAIASLVERGYARTTAVEVCARAGVTRGAFHHHFAGMAELYGEALRSLYGDLVRDAAAKSARRAALSPLAGFVQLAWTSTRRPEFKAIIEIWLAARNDEDLRGELAPLIEQLSSLFSPTQNPRLAKRLGKGRSASGFYRLVMETMIGMALGRAVSVDGRSLAHEKVVVDLLLEVAASFDGAAA